MAETIYVKYNGTRRKDFQIKTAIRLEQGEKTVDKTALCPEGEAISVPLKKNTVCFLRRADG